jgi:hypothetical protein
MQFLRGYVVVKPDLKGLGQSVVFIVVELLSIVLLPFAYGHDKCCKYKLKKADVSPEIK